jgi:hypothetical protein
MVGKTLTFLGAGLATFVWARVIMTIDISSTVPIASVIGPLGISISVATIFVICEYVFRPRPVEYLGQVFRNVSVISLLGSVTSVGFLILILAVFGYLELRYLPLEIISFFVLGFILFISTFGITLLLKSIDYWFGKRRIERLE